ncbi:hypothetical protein D1007_43581 [Hordeum vulgare]|nr:hypothetical protein D1007_43581 [Hordeum vulgare]
MLFLTDMAYRSVSYKKNRPGLFRSEKTNPFSLHPDRTGKRKNPSFPPYRAHPTPPPRLPLTATIATPRRSLPPTHRNHQHRSTLIYDAIVHRLFPKGRPPALPRTCRTRTTPSACASASASRQPALEAHGGRPSPPLHARGSCATASATSPPVLLLPYEVERVAELPPPAGAGGPVPVPAAEPPDEGLPARAGHQLRPVPHLHQRVHPAPPPPAPLRARPRPCAPFAHLVPPLLARFRPRGRAAGVRGGRLPRRGEAAAVVPATREEGRVGVVGPSRRRVRRRRP